MSLEREPLCRWRRLVRGRRTHSSRCRLISPTIECSLFSLHRCFSVRPWSCNRCLNSLLLSGHVTGCSMAGLGWCSPLRPYSPSPLTHTFAALRNPTFLSYTGTHTQTHTQLTRHISHQLPPALGSHTANLQVCNRVSRSGPT
ncbi:hypothetical protein CCUS01_17045 [Colletotrichum cuscutae]|uniref:Uncharacterized protein n=1 Tax=Colletotrichum cuscutae TaxID=1209917 RepID=A0AAI9V763_9PEZI|nr:hypothetical protein CCUS01_17045 [Colletotrichum cuscutae]